MSISSRLIAWIFKLPPAETLDVVVEKDVKTPMADGVVLLADRAYRAIPGPVPGPPGTGGSL